MSLSSGTRLGHYDVGSLIGEGGMGQVWQATDTQLNRQVALKILPDAFADDPDRLARFQREAQVLASLNHPNIAQIHGIEEAQETRALVLELVEGPTLADRIAKGPIPVDEALPIAKQIAEALEAAHEAGVIHRDLKPANIKVREDGTVKVLDFGLAKAVDTVPAGNPDQSPTLTAAATQMGVIMGTAAYMSPEQARGKTVDKRADIWAFGVVLYEMLSGARPFQGEDVSLTLASVMKSDLNVTPLPADVPATVRTVLARCLEKDPNRRIRDIGDVQLAMEGAFDGAGGGRLEAEDRASAPLRIWQRPIPVLVAVGVVAALSAVIGAWVFSPREADESVDVLRTTVAAPGLARVMSDTLAGRGLAISPDGMQIVYVGPAVDGGFGTNLYRRALDELDPEPIDGTVGASDPFFSPDGEWIGFMVNPGGRLLKVRTVGGAQELLAEVSSRLRGGSWGAANQIIVGTRGGGLAELPADGGDPTPLTTLDADSGELSHAMPSLTPDGRGILFVISEGPQSGLLAVLDRATGQVTRLGLAGTHPRYVSSGHLVYASPDGTLTAVPFDPERLELQGRPVAVVEGLWMGNLNSGASYGVSDAGRLVYVSGTTGEPVLAWIDRSGRTIERIEDTQVLGTPRLSPDGQRLAFNDTEGEIAILDLDRGGAVRLSEGAEAYTPAWSPDGSVVTYSAIRETTINLYSRPADFSGPEELLFERPEPLIAGGWSSDGQTFVYYQTTGATNRDIWALLANGEPTPVRATEFNEFAPSLSPDGHWVAFVSSQDGRDRVYMQPLGGGRLVPVSTGPGNEPLWSRDGRELFYRDGTRMMVVEVEPGPNATVGTPELLFEGGFRTDPNGVGIANYDVAPDGRSFIMVTFSQSEESMPTIVLVNNWFEELKARAPVP